MHATGDVIQHQIEQDGTALLLRPTWRFWSDPPHDVTIPMRSCAHAVPHTGAGARVRAGTDCPGGTRTGQGTYVAPDPRALELGRSGGDCTASWPMRSISRAPGSSAWCTPQSG